MWNLSKPAKGRVNVPVETDHDDLTLSGTRMI
jgi:hypothetical protein